MHDTVNLYATLSLVCPICLAERVMRCVTRTCATNDMQQAVVAIILVKAHAAILGKVSRCIWREPYL